MRLATVTNAILTSTIIVSLQACSPVESKDNKSSSSQNAYNSAENSGNGNPFDGKVWRAVDRLGCGQIHAGLQVKTEIVRVKAVYQLTVDNCEPVSAQNVTDRVNRDPASRALTYNAETLNRIPINTQQSGLKLVAVCHNAGSLEIKVWKDTQNFQLSFRNRFSGKPPSPPLTAVIESNNPTRLKSAYLLDGVSGTFVLTISESSTKAPMQAKWQVNTAGTPGPVESGTCFQIGAESL